MPWFCQLGNALMGTCQEDMGRGHATGGSPARRGVVAAPSGTAKTGTQRVQS